jgi:hypothetical protein
MSLQAQVFIIIMVVGFVLGGMAALSDKGRGIGVTRFCVIGHV